MCSRDFQKNLLGKKTMEKGDTESDSALNPFPNDKF